MELTSNEKSDIKLQLKAVNDANISEDVFKKLIENTFAVLSGNPPVHNFTSLYNSKPDVIKGVAANLLRVSSEFGRHSLSKQTVQSFLVDECKFSTHRANLFADFYDRNKRKLDVSLGNIGLHLPHVVDVRWKIDDVVESNNLNRVDGPLFRIALITSKFDEVEGARKCETVNFTCNSQELQDLIYKLKDASRHCQHLIVEH